jgi:predicted metal-dependent hydrolase
LNAVKLSSRITTLATPRPKEYTILVGELPIVVTRKRIRRVYVRVHPPEGRVTISAPSRASRRDVEQFAASQLDWIRRQRERVQRLPKETPSQFATGEVHYVWGRPHHLTVVDRSGRQRVVPDDETLTMFVRPGSSLAVRAAVMTAWHKALLHQVLPPLIQKWELRLNVRLEGYYLRRMTSRWGTCNCRARHIRLNTELATRAAHLLEYVVVHELVHLIVPNHGQRFVALMHKHYPAWRDARAELNGSRPPRL